MSRTDRTFQRVASRAGRVHSDPRADADAKSLAGSAPTEARDRDDRPRRFRRRRRRRLTAATDDE